MLKGVTSINMTLEDVASELNDLVKTHPSEGAIVIVKGEGNDAESGDIQIEVAAAKEACVCPEGNAKSFGALTSSSA